MSGVRRLVVATAVAALLLFAAGGVLAQPVAKSRRTFSSAVCAASKASSRLDSSVLAKATAVGKFDVDIGSISLNACSAYTLKVVGAQGSHVALTHPVEPC